MKPKSIENAMLLADSVASLLRTTALTVGPPLLRFAGDDKKGRMFTGIVKEPPRVVAPEAQVIHPFGKAITYACVGCGGRDVRIAAYAEWNNDAQKWECQATYLREAECAHCGTHTQIMPRPLSQAHA